MLHGHVVNEISQVLAFCDGWRQNKVNSSRTRSPDQNLVLGDHVLAPFDLLEGDLLNCGFIIAKCPQALRLRWPSGAIILHKCFRGYHATDWLAVHEGGKRDAIPLEQPRGWDFGKLDSFCHIWILLR